MNGDLEWGWRTSFDHIGIVADLGSGTELKAQALQGRTHMGYPMPVRRWIDERFRAAYVLVTHPIGKVGLAARLDAFDTRNRGSLWTGEYDEHGWSAMLAAKREFGRVTALVEWLHVHSETPAREHAAGDETQSQTQLQAELRMHW